MLKLKLEKLDKAVKAVYVNRRYLVITLVLFLFACILISVFLLNRRNIDNRGKSASGSPVTVNFNSTSLNLGVIGSEVKADVNIESATTSKVSGVHLTVDFPSELLEFNYDKTLDQSNASSGCKSLDNVLYLSNSTVGQIRMSKVAIKNDPSLPSGKFCFGSLFFKVKSTSLTSNSKLLFTGDLNDINYWDIVANDGRHPVVLGSAMNLTTSVTVSPSPVSSTKQYGDFNGDKIINILDLSILAANWMQNTPNGDANGDGVVNLIDLSILSSNWEKSF